MILTKEDINHKEVLRYLGNPDGVSLGEDLDSLILQAEEEALGAVKAGYLYRVCDLSFDSTGVVLAGTSLCLSGKSIAEHLLGAQKSVVMVATLGVAMDQLIARTQYKDMTKTVVLDSIAAALIETVCNRAESEILSQEELSDYSSNFRFSPGYGDLPMELQPQFLAVLDATRKLGLTCTPTNILIPRKSVTAVFGLFENAPLAVEKSCEGCVLWKTCRLRKGGISCGHPKTAATGNIDF